MTANPLARPYRVLRDTAVNWRNDIVWLMPRHVRDYHVPVTELPKPAAQTTRDAAVPSHPERINDWLGSDASGEGTSIWHPEGRQQPPPEIPDMTDPQIADLKEFMRPMRELAIYQLEQAKQPLPVAPTTRSILAQQTAEVEAARAFPDEAPLETKTYPDGTRVTGTGPLPDYAPPPSLPVGTTGPYAVVPKKGLGGEDRWDVVDANGLSAGYINEPDNTEAGAAAFADFLNNHHGEAPG